jgi:ATP-binding cassette subfamily B protein
LVFYFALSRRLLPLISQIFFIVGQMEGSYDNVVRVDSELRDGLLNKNPIRPLLLPGEGFVLELNRMNYSFRQDVPILQELSLHLRKGETMVLRGVSGSGKSSLLNVLAGVSQSTSGAVRVDRGRIAYVLQEIPLLDDTIRNNLLFGLTNRSDEELMNALVAAKLEGLVAAPPLGLETALGDNRILFSGGERQRLGVGRAIVRCATLLLLDEATSALDEENERQLLDNLRASGIATIVVTHRTHAQPVAQRQVLLEQGCLIEDASGRSLRDKEESVLELHSDPNVEGLLAVST